MRRDVLLFAIGNTLGRKFGRALDRVVKVVPIQVHSGNDRTDDIARAATVATDTVHHDRFRLFALAVDKVHNLPVFAMDSGHHDMFGPLGAQLLAKVFQFGVVEIAVAIFRVGQCAEFRQVRGQDIGITNQALHLFGKRGRIGLVEESVVAHHRVDKGEHAGFLESPDKIDNDIHLFFGAQKTGRNRVERHVQILVGLDIVAHFRSVVVKIVFGELRMRRKNRRRHRNRLNLHRRNDRRHDGNRAASEARDIIDERYLFLWHDRSKIEI